MKQQKSTEQHVVTKDFKQSAFLGNTLLARGFTEVKFGGKAYKWHDEIIKLNDEEGTLEELWKKLELPVKPDLSKEAQVVRVEHFTNAGFDKKQATALVEAIFQWIDLSKITK